jgi:hypothetical protein
MNQLRRGINRLSVLFLKDKAPNPTRKRENYTPLRYWLLKRPKAALIKPVQCLIVEGNLPKKGMETQLGKQPLLIFFSLDGFTSLIPSFVNIKEAHNAKMGLLSCPPNAYAFYSWNRGPPLRRLRRRRLLLWDMRADHDP